MHLAIRAFSPGGTLDDWFPRYESVSVEWVDGLLLNALPALIILSILVALHPVTRRLRPWRGIGAAWLATIVATSIVAVTHLNEWSLTCGQQLFPGSRAAPGFFVPAAQPCNGANSLPIWLTALPLLIGIAVLIAWALRSVSPTDVALRTIGLVVLVVLAVLGIAQLSPNAALLAFLAAAVAIYAWPRLQGARTA